MRAAIAAAVTALVAVFLVATIHSSAGEQAGTTIRGEIAGQQVRLEMPTGDLPPRGLALWFHGQGGTVNDRVDGPFLSALRRDGWAIASSDYHDQSWGDVASTSDTEAVQKWAEAKSGLPTSLWVSGSMGGSVSLNALIFGVKPPTCWYGVKPAISLTQMGDVPTANHYIAAAYHGAVPAARDTVRNVGKLPLSVTYRVVASHGDTWVKLDQNAGPLIDSVKKRGGRISLLTAVGPHEDPSEFDPPDLISFADSCLTRSPGIPDSAVEDGAAAASGS